MLEYIYIFLLGLFIGSFLNVLADRLSKEQSINGRSRCDHCKHILAWYDLIPIISFTLLKGKCRYCRAPISQGHLYAEIFTGVIFLLTWYLSNSMYPYLVQHIIHLSIASILTVMLLADFRYQIIPDEMQISLGILGIARFFVNFLNPYLPIPEQIVSRVFAFEIYNLLIAGLVVSIPLLLVFLVTKGKGMGFGDVKLSFNIGLVVGLWNGLYALYIAFVAGGLIGVVILLTKRASLKSKIAFGPFLIIGLYLLMFYSYEVTDIIQRIYRF